VKKVISFASVKGGTGKSTLSILTALTLSAQGKKVLFIDLDPQNSSTFFFVGDPGYKSIFKVFMGDDVEKQIIKTEFNIDLLPSDLRLLDCRTIETNKIKKLLPKVDYDYCIIDTAPTYDALTQNAYFASDIIIIPSTVDAFSYKTCHFLIEKFQSLDIEADINILLNLWTPPKDTVKPTAWSVRESDLFRKDETINTFLMNNHIPRTMSLRRIIAEKGYRLKGKSLEPITNLVYEITGEQLEIDFIGEVVNG